MRNPTTTQLALMRAAHRNGGRLPSQSFARYGMYAPYGGTEKITEALAVAAQTRSDADAVSILLGQLNRNQLAMAGGFLGVERSWDFAPGTLAEQYVAAIRDGYIRTEDGAAIRPATLTACIRHGWLDAKWRLTDVGWAAGRETDPAGFALATTAAPIEIGTMAAGEPVAVWFGADVDPAQLPEVNHGLLARSAGSRGAGKSNLLGQIMRMSWDDRLLIGEPKLLPPGWGRVYGGGTPEEGQPVQMYHVTPADVAGAMAGFRPAGLSADEQALLSRNLPPALYRRLAPPVTGAAVLTLLPHLEMVRDAIVDQLPEGADRDAVAGDIQAGCYRVALHLARRVAEQEKARAGLMLLELALTQLADGRTAAASGMLTRALSKLDL